MWLDNNILLWKWCCYQMLQNVGQFSANIFRQMFSIVLPFRRNIFPNQKLIANKKLF